MSLSEPPGDYDEDGDAVEFRLTPYGSIGAAGYVSSEKAGVERVARLREVVAEVTKGRIPVVDKRGPRF